jgi:hypothetical protein
MSRLPRALFTVAVVLAVAPAARAHEVTLQNDKFVAGGALDFGAGLIKGEAVGETFQPPDSYYPFTIKSVQFIAAGAKSGAMGTFTIKVYQDTGAVDPGMMLTSFSASANNVPLTGDMMKLQEAPLPSPLMVASGAVRIALEAAQDTSPNGLTIPFDRSAAITKASTVCAILNPPDGGAAPPCAWSYFSSLGGKGTWVIRLVIDTNGGPPDMAVAPDAAMAGAPVVTSISPATVPSGMTAVQATISGQGFAPAATVRLIGAKGPMGLTGPQITPGSISVMTPAMLPVGAYDVVIVNPNGQMGSLPGGFTVSGGGCACDLGGGASPPWFALALLALLFLSRRHRRAAAATSRRR